MRAWRHLLRGLRALFHRRAADRDLADEVAAYLADAAADLESRGLSPAEARRAARLEAGTALTLREQVRTAGWEDSVATAASDLRQAARRLCGNAGFTVVGVLTLALGIGATTAIFSVIDGVLLKPLPYPESGRIVALRHTAPGIGIQELNLSISLYFTYREENRVFDEVGMWTTGTAGITGLAEPEEVETLSATCDFLRVLRIRPALGRAFTPADDAPNGERTVILSDAWWKSRFGGDPSVLGRRILVDGYAFEVIGVLPPGFGFMDQKFSLLLPFRADRAAVKLISFCCQGIARLKPGVTMAQANADVARMIPMAPAKFALNPGAPANAFYDARIAPTLLYLKDALLGDIAGTLWVLMGTVGIVLLIACANVANLFLVRADGRRQELAIRSALGAGWTRIARDLLLESALLGLAGGVLGVALAFNSLRLLTAIAPAHLPRLQEISIDPTVLAFALTISLGAGLLFGAIPVFKYALPNQSPAWNGATRSLTHSKERQRTRSALIVVQVALALVLLVGSGLMIRTFLALRRVDPGFFRAQDVETFHIFIPDRQVHEAEWVVRMEEAILRKIEGLAGVSAAGMVSTIPMDGGSNNPIFAEGQPLEEGAMPPIRRFKFIAPGYASAIGARLIAGRDLTWTEIYNQTPVVLISENLAREHWGDPQAALGKRIRSSLTDDWREIVGVLGDLRDDGVDQKAPAIVYWPIWQKNFRGGGTLTRGLAYIVRTPRAGSASLRREIQQTVSGVNASLPAAGIRTLQSWYDRSLARSTFTLVLLALAAAMALLLGLIGIYGVISYSVAQRSREIGIRLALGAPLPQVIAMFVHHALALSALGAAGGLAAAFALTRWMKSLLYEVSPADPLTFAAVPAGLLLAALLASYLPARKATRVDPAEALRVS